MEVLKLYNITDKIHENIQVYWGAAASDTVNVCPPLIQSKKETWIKQC